LGEGIKERIGVFDTHLGFVGHQVDEFFFAPAFEHHSTGQLVKARE
jgi:hypothetical protein